MAPGLLRWGLALAALTAGCLVPNDYYLVPDPVNSPPVIDTQAVDPDATQEVDGRVLWDPATTPRGLEFRLRSISDQDVGDKLYVTWLVSHDASNIALDREWGFDELPGGSTVQRPPVAFSLTTAMADSIDVARAAIGDGGTGRRPYLVEVLVSDQRPSGSAQNEYPAGANVARWRWVVIRSSSGGQ